MVRLNPRLAAGVGVLSAFLVLGGSSAVVATADPGGERSDRGTSESDDGGRWRGESGGSDSDRSETSRSAGDGDTTLGDNPASSESPPVRIGSGRSDTQQVMPDDESASVGSNDDARSGSVSGSGGGPTFGGPGSARSDASNSGFSPPRVTVGNGRSPGILSGDDSEPRWRVPAAEPAPAPPPPPPPPPAVESSWVDQFATPSVLPKQLAVAPAADWAGPLWGIAGLLLIPAAGAVLGYRQALAAHAVERLSRP